MNYQSGCTTQQLSIFIGIFKKIQSSPDFQLNFMVPTLSLGINRSSEPCLRKTLPAVWEGLIPIPSSVIIALVAGGTLNSSAANLSTAVKGVFSGTERLQKLC